MSELIHLDNIAAAFAWALERLAHPSENTLDRLDVYRGISQTELFPAPDALPTVTTAKRWSVAGIHSEDLVFPSLHEPLEPSFRERYRAEDRESHTVYARRILPSRSAKRRPRLLYLHGYMQPETYLEEFALLTSAAVALDVEIIQPQPPYHGRRTPRRAIFDGSLYLTADLVRSLEALRQSIFDARTLLSWLHAEDSRPVGVLGLSLGGALSLTLTCVENRLEFSVPMIAHMDLAAIVRDAPVLGPMRRELRKLGFRRDDFQRLVRDLGWYELAPRLPAEKIRIFAASDDRFFDPSLVKQLWERWGRPETSWYPCSHMGFIPRLPLILPEVRAFIDRHA